MPITDSKGYQKLRLQVYILKDPFYHTKETIEHTWTPEHIENNWEAICPIMLQCPDMERLFIKHAVISTCGKQNV